MKNIEVNEVCWDIRALYSAATTPARRSLLGYMLFTGRSDDMIFGGAYSLLKNIEESKGEVYFLKFNADHAKEIISIVEVARAGGFSKFELSPFKVRTICKRVNILLDEQCKRSEYGYNGYNGEY